MSYRKINYKLRPAKTVERKMIAEIFRKLSVLTPIEEYQYIGFGSIYFVDFSLFHKSLGISKMISIEGDEQAKKRVDFNRPFSCIEIHYDSSNNVLPKLNLTIPSIIWLDYDGKLDETALFDINTVCANCETGTAFLLTFNAQPESQFESEPTEDGVPKEKISLSDFRLECLQQQISRKKIPAGVSGKDLSTNGLPSVIRKVVINEIESALGKRNGLLNDNAKLSFQQLFNIRYNDGASMVTIGGVIVNEEEKKILSATKIDEVSFCSSNENAYQIKIPNLTNKEIAHLDSELHDLYDFTTKTIKRNRKDKSIILDSDIINYAKVYRFYPTFTESIW